MIANNVQKLRRTIQENHMRLISSISAKILNELDMRPEPGKSVPQQNEAVMEMIKQKLE